MIAQKPVKNRVCPAVSTRGMVCGKDIDSNANGCKTHPNGIGSNKSDIVLTPEQASIWLEIESFFANPINKNNFQFDCSLNTAESKSPSQPEFFIEKGEIKSYNIYRVEATSIARELAEKLGNRVGSDKIIFFYCLDRLFRKLEINKESSWYPVLNRDSTDIAGFNCSSRFYSYFINKVKDLVLLNNVEAIQYVCRYEYGYVLKPLQDIQTVLVADIELSKCSIMDGKILLNKGLTAYNKYWHENIKQNLPIGIAYKQDNNDFVIIDGFHRYLSSVGLGYKTEKFIIYG